MSGGAMPAYNRTVGWQGALNYVYISTPKGSFLLFRDLIRLKTVAF